MKFIKNLTVSGWALICAIVTSLVGFIVYAVSGTTGFLAGKPLDALAVTFSIIALVLMVAVLVVGDKVPAVKGWAVAVAGILIGVVVCRMILDRLSIFADVWFIPVNYPKAEDATCAATIVSAVFYVIGLAGATMVAISDETKKA